MTKQLVSRKKKITTGRQKSRNQEKAKKRVEELETWDWKKIGRLGEPGLRHEAQNPLIVGEVSSNLVVHHKKKGSRRPAIGGKLSGWIGENTPDRYKWGERGEVGHGRAAGKNGKGQGRRALPTGRYSAWLGERRLACSEKYNATLHNGRGAKSPVPRKARKYDNA